MISPPKKRLILKFCTAKSALSYNQRALCDIFNLTQVYEPLAFPAGTAPNVVPGSQFPLDSSLVKEISYYFKSSPAVTDFADFFLEKDVFIGALPEKYYDHPKVKSIEALFMRYIQAIYDYFPGEILIAECRQLFNLKWLEHILTDNGFEPIFLVYTRDIWQLCYLEYLSGSFANNTIRRIDERYQLYKQAFPADDMMNLPVQSRMDKYLCITALELEAMTKAAKKLNNCFFFTYESLFDNGREILNQINRTIAGNKKGDELEKWANKFFKGKGRINEHLQDSLFHQKASIASRRLFQNVKAYSFPSKQLPTITLSSVLNYCASIDKTIVTYRLLRFLRSKKKKNLILKKIFHQSN